MNIKRKISLTIYLYIQNTLNIFPDFVLGNRLRRLFYKLYLKKAGQNLTVSAHVHIEEPNKIEVGNNCSFNRGCWISGGGGLQLGNDVIIGPNVIIHSANHIYLDPSLPIRAQGHELKKVIISNNVWIGAGAIILPGVTINENSIIAAGAVVTKVVPANSLVGGVPSRLIKHIYE